MLPTVEQNIPLVFLPLYKKSFQENPNGFLVSTSSPLFSSGSSKKTPISYRIQAKSLTEPKGV